jgi:hypothetical protein
MWCVKTEGKISFHDLYLPMKKILSLILVFIICLTSCSAPVLPLQPRDALQNTQRMNVRLHPDGALFVGDQVSFEVIHVSDVKETPDSISISLDGQVLGEGKFEPFGLGGRSQSTLYWVWNTSGMQPGEYSLTFIAQPGPVAWEETITLHASEKIPPPEPGAQWASVEIPCCVIHYISGTDAEKQLETLKSVASAQAASVEQRMSAKIDKKIPVTFLPRTLGHGGFASDGIYVSYLQNNYAGSTAGQIIHHEMVHWLDRQLGGDFKPSILQEGLAVYLSDGHFKVEPILPRAAALLDLNWYVPLRQLTNSFYRSQHEVGYIQAAALVSYLISSYGWQDFNQFYRNIQPAAGGSEADALDAALIQHFGVTLENLDVTSLSWIHRPIF